MMIKVSLEEKLIAQMKNVISILEGEDDAYMKITLFEMQREYLEALLDDIESKMKSEFGGNQ